LKGWIISSLHFDAFLDKLMQNLFVSLAAVKILRRRLKVSKIRITAIVTRTVFVQGNSSFSIIVRLCLVFHFPNA
jgi:hypothetical protein